MCPFRDVREYNLLALEPPVLCVQQAHHGMCEQVLFRFVDDPFDVILGLVEFGVNLIRREGRLDVTSFEERSMLHDDFRTAGRDIECDSVVVFHLDQTCGGEVMWFW